MARDPRAIRAPVSFTRRTAHELRVLHVVDEDHGDVVGTTGGVRAFDELHHRRRQVARVLGDLEQLFVGKVAR